MEGAMLYQISNSTVYFFNGFYWVKFSGDFSKFLNKSDSINGYLTPYAITSYALKDSVYFRHSIDSVFATKMPLVPDTIHVNDSIWLNGKWVNGVSSDSALGDGSDNILPTQGAVKTYINRFSPISLVDAKDTIFSSSGTGWYEKIRELGNIIRINSDSSVMLFSGYSGSYSEDGAVYAGIAFSTDNGKTFSNPIQLGNEYMEDPYLVHYNGQWMCFGEYKHDTLDTYNAGIGLYTSSDLQNWEWRGNVMPTTDSIFWESGAAASPTMLVKDDTLFMFYEGIVVHDGGIGSAYSLDGFHWNRSDQNPLVSATDYTGTSLLKLNWGNFVVPDDIFRIGDTYYLTVHVSLTFEPKYYNGILESTDLINWKSYLAGGIDSKDLNAGNGLMVYKNESGVVSFYSIGNDNKSIVTLSSRLGNYNTNISKKEAIDLNIGGVNYLPNSNDFSNIRAFNGSSLTLSDSTTVNEWNAADATNVFATGGNSTLKAMLQENIPPSVVGQKGILSFWLNNKKTKPIKIIFNGFLKSSLIFPPGYSGRVIARGAFRVSPQYFQIQFLTKNIDDSLDFNIWHLQFEKSDLASDWRPSFSETNVSSSDIQKWNTAYGWGNFRDYGIDRALLINTDWNLIDSTILFYNTNPSTPNTPTPTSYISGLNITSINGYSFQLAAKVGGTGELYYRTSAGAWNTWQRIAERSWVLGQKYLTADSLSGRYIFGSATFSGDGAATDFNVSTSAGFTPTKIIIAPTSADAAGAQFYVDKSTITSTQFTVKAVGTTPPSGTDNITFDYELIK